MENTVSIVIPTWNSERTLAACLESVGAQKSYCGETIAVDNGSRDQTINMLSAVRGVRTIRLAHNTGFARACNIGIRQSRSQFVLLLNADARLAPDFLERLIPEVVCRQSVGAATGKLLRLPASGEPRIDSAGILLQRRLFSPCDRGENEPDRGQYDTLEPVFGPSGAAALYRRQALEDVRVREEYLDEQFFAYYEDVDLAWRLQLRGWKSLYVPQAVAWHRRSGPAAQPIQISARFYFNRYFCYMKNEMAANYGDYAIQRLLREAARSLWHMLKKPRLLLGIPRALALLPHMLAKRRFIQGRVTVTAKSMSEF